MTEFSPSTRMPGDRVAERADRKGKRKVVFLFGSRSVEEGPPAAREEVRRLFGEGCSFVVGDAPGADCWFMQVLQKIGAEHVTVYHVGKSPRVPVPDPRWRLQSVEPGKNRWDYYVTKDEEMTRIADMGICVLDGKSRGSAANRRRLESSGKVCKNFSIGSGKECESSGSEGLFSDPRENAPTSNADVSKKDRPPAGSKELETS